MSDKGITDLQKLVKFIISGTEIISNVDSDHDDHVSLVEKLSAIGQVGIKIPGLISAMAGIKEEWKDLSREELDLLVADFVAEFDLPGLETGKIEAIIKRTVTMIVYNYNYFRDIKAITAA
ncbi:MAG TPA: hypothetical protein VFG10_19015 [Saprospiraceae bacterium]|nr:hypothetical protein [Saprospiraceae bacterium]